MNTRFLKIPNGCFLELKIDADHLIIEPGHKEEYLIEVIENYLFDWFARNKQRCFSTNREKDIVKIMNRCRDKSRQIKLGKGSL